MPRSFARALCAATLCSLAPVAIAAGLPADLGERLARDYARPAMARMAQASEQMDAALGAWCARPDAAGATRVNDAHTGLALAWSGIEFLRFGPLVQANRYERLAFWPDTRGVMPRQVQAAIAAQDPELIKPGAMAGRSVALQACRRWNTCCTASRRCSSEPTARTSPMPAAMPGGVRQRVRHLARIDAGLGAEGDFGRQFAAPRPANDLYRNSQEVAAEAVKALSTGLQFARDVKILPVLGDAPEAARPKRAAYWRSNLSSRTLASSLDAMLAFHRAGAHPLPQGGAGSTRPCAAVARRADPARRGGALPGRGQRRRDAPPMDAGRVDLEERQGGGRPGPGARAGVTIGFNALDGD